MATKVLLATPSPEVRDHLGHVFAEAEGFELAAAVSDGPGVLTALDRQPDIGIVVVDEAADDGHGHAVARAVGLATPLTGIVMVVDAHGPAEMSRAMAAAMEVGARSVIARNAGLEEVLTRLEAVASWSAMARASIAAERNGGRSGQVVAIAGAKGGVGTSVLALLLARAGRAGDTVLVDLDLGGGDLTAYTGVRTRRSVVDLAAVEGEITGRMLRETTYEVPGGLRLLPAPGEGERGEEMTSAAARSVVSALRFESGLAVIDVGTHLDEPRATALEFADRVLLVTTPDLPALRAARRSLAQWDRLAIRRPSAVELVLNRRTSRDEVTPALVERIVERPVAFTVPDGGPAFSGAVNTATLLETPTAVHAAVAKVGVAALQQDATAHEGTSDGPTEVESLVAGSARRTGESTGRARAGRRRAGRAGTDREAGQSTVELPVVILLVLTVVVLCVQGIGLASGLLAARAAAQEGARTVGVLGYYDEDGGLRDGVVEEVRDDVRDRLPDSLRGTVADSDIEVLPETVSVRVTVSTIVPGMDLSASSSAAVYREG
jgi:Flp pilus assembly CpaE family ATPase